MILSRTKYRSLLLVFIVQFMVAFLSCSGENDQGNLNSWLGKYQYDETPVKSFAGYQMAMSWDLSVHKIGNMHKSILNVTGQQTIFSLVNDVVANDSTLFIIYSHSLSGEIQGLQPGDTLFSITHKSRRLLTTWNKLMPILYESSPKECTCFFRAAGTGESLTK